mgnify:CR=1 FL=1
MTSAATQVLAPDLLAISHGTSSSAGQAAVAALVYGAMISLVFLVHPNQTEMTVRVPLDNGAAPEEN